MKRKQARLAELRAMPYEEYLLTPEWQETRTAAFAWAGNQCQQCLATHVPLGAYHTSDEHRGAEQEGEVIVLCEPCYARLSAEPYPDFSLSTKAALFGPAAVVTVGVPLLLHAPLPAELFGLGAAIALAVTSPTLYGQMKEALPAPVVDLLDGLVARRHARHHARQWSRWDRLLGRHLHEQVQDEQETEHEEGEQDVSQGDAPAAAKCEPCEQDCLQLGEQLRPPARDVLSKRLGMFGIPGSGKSNGVAVFCEELGRLAGIGVPFVLADTEDEYGTLFDRRYLLRPYRAGAHNVTAENAFAFGQAVLERGRQVILNLQSYESDDQAAAVMIGMIAGLRAWAEERPNDERATCMFILDEAAIWLPQRVEESLLSREKDEHGQSLLARLHQAFFGTVVRRGRKRGIGFLFATQRPADLDKRCISCDWLILFQQTFPNDLNKYAELGVPKEAAAALAPGEAFVLDPQGSKSIQQFRRRSSADGAQTPGLALAQTC